MGVIELLGATAEVVAGCMLAMWLLSLVLRDASIVDIFWGLGFVVIAVSTFLWTNDGSSARRGLITALVGLWGLRLAVYLLWRNAGHGEDPTCVAEQDRPIQTRDPAARTRPLRVGRRRGHQQGARIRVAHE